MGNAETIHLLTNKLYRKLMNNFQLDLSFKSSKYT